MKGPYGVIESAEVCVSSEDHPAVLTPSHQDLINLRKYLINT